MTFVLVHGGGCTDACWGRLVPLLDGEAVCVDLPGRGPRADVPVAKVSRADCVDAIVDDIVSHDLHDVVLVGHSWTGTMLPGVLAAIPERVSHLVFLASPMPPDGNALIDNIDPEVRDAVVASMGDGVFRVDPPTAEVILCNDMDDDQKQFTLGQMVDDAAGILFEPVDLEPLDGPIRRTYISTQRDQTLPPDQQERSRAAMGDPPTVFIDSGHMAMISRPRELTEILNGLT